MHILSVELNTDWLYSIISMKELGVRQHKNCYSVCCRTHLQLAGIVADRQNSAIKTWVTSAFTNTTEGESVVCVSLNITIENMNIQKHMHTVYSYIVTSTSAYMWCSNLQFALQTTLPIHPVHNTLLTLSMFCYGSREASATGHIEIAIEIK